MGVRCHTCVISSNGSLQLRIDLKLARGELHAGSAALQKMSDGGRGGSKGKGSASQKGGGGNPERRWRGGVGTFENMNLHPNILRAVKR